MAANGDPARPAMREPHCTVTRRAGLARGHGHATIIASVTIAATRARNTVASRSSFANFTANVFRPAARAYQSRNHRSEVINNLESPAHVISDPPLVR